MAAPILQVQDLHFAYADQAPLFVDWAASVPAGITLVDGEPSCGKSTLLRLLAGELRGCGRFTLTGQRLETDSAAWRRQVCWIDPRDAAWDELTPGELMAAQRARHPALDEQAWQRHVAGFGLAPHLVKPMYALSTGSRRKAALAIALSANCPLTLLDEPTAGLDGPSVAWLAQALAEANQAWLLASAYGLEGRLALAGTLTL